MSQQINLYNPQFAPQAKPFAARTMAICLALFVLVVVAQYGFVRHQARGLDRALRDADAALATQRQQVTRLTGELAAIGGGKALSDELARTEARLAARRDLLAGMTTGISAGADGYSSLMGALARRTAHGIWITGLSVNESNAVSIRGRLLGAALMPAYLDGLTAEAAFRGRSVTELKVASRGEPQPAAKAPAPSSASAPAAGPARYVEFTLGMTPPYGSSN